MKWIFFSLPFPLLSSPLPFPQSPFSLHSQLFNQPKLHVKFTYPFLFCVVEEIASYLPRRALVSWLFLESQDREVDYITYLPIFLATYKASDRSAWKEQWRRRYIHLLCLGDPEGRFQVLVFSVELIALFLLSSSLGGFSEK